MGRSKRKSLFKDHAINVGAAAISIGVISLVVASIVSVVRCNGFKSTFAAAAAEHIGPTLPVTVAAISSARDAVHAVALARGVAPEKIKCRIERREIGSSGFTHVVALEAAAGACEPAFERVLDRQLTDAELLALADLGFRECDSCKRGRHHHHSRTPESR